MSLSGHLNIKDMSLLLRNRNIMAAEEWGVDKEWRVKGQGCEREVRFKE